MAGAGWLDPLAMPRNGRAPGVLIRSLRAGGRDYPAADGLHLPEGTRTVELAFTATALSIPERARLRYRLEGVDPDWRDVQHERAASYTNLAPGNYRFQVIAANEDGVWNTAGAAIVFDIAPAFWQTAWFRALGAAAGIFMLGLLYRWRLAVAARRATERANARLEERERIARSLHDTLLQAVQGLVLRFQAEVMRMPPDSPSAAVLDTALADADRLIASTRDEVMALRRVPRAAELLDELRAAVSTLAPGSDHLLRCELRGEARALRGEAAGEIFCALREAAVNSVRHAQATRIAIVLHFLPGALEASVVDDGVGIDRKVAQSGRAGHFGLVGMRERVRHLGGRITVTAAPGGGTAVRIRIPARAAYQAAPRRPWRARLPPWKRSAGA
jgi:signal transduction histidine kinase